MPACGLERASKRGGAQPDQHPSVVQHALRHADAARTRHQRLRQARLEVIQRRTILASDLDDIFEARRRQQNDPRTPALE